MSTSATTPTPTPAPGPSGRAGWRWSAARRDNRDGWLLVSPTVIVVVAILDPAVPWMFATLALGLSVLIWWRHRDNLGRVLVLAREAKRREAELERDHEDEGPKS